MISREHYERFRVSPADPTTLRIADVDKALSKFAAASPGRLGVEKFADSFAGRPIYLATLGTGPRRVLMWSQMHGDEPTHTAVVLDLLSYLLQSPAEPQSQDILSGCTLSIVPMLNPDGAERTSRFNAQDIDVNRDARRLATPEGRALRRAVETIRPEFAFNLHNQNARTAAGTQPKTVIASLLAPPPDASRTETDAVRRAVLVASCIAQSVRPDVDHVDGVISRYDDTYERRAFGDWIQSTGAATVLIEAGGWPEDDPEPLVRLHFQGLLAALHAIATDSYRSADPAVYLALPESNDSNLVDCLLTGGQVTHAERGTTYTADLAINYSNGNRLGPSNRTEGKIADVGDLSVLGAKRTINATNCLVLPGRIAIVNDWNLSAPLPPDRLDALLEAGVTTALGVVHSTSRTEIENAISSAEMPLNWGFVVRLDAGRVLSTELIERLAYAISCGAVTILGDLFESGTRNTLAKLDVPLVEADMISKSSGLIENYRQQAHDTWKTHELLGLSTNRGRIGRDYFADLQLLHFPPAIDQPAPRDRNSLKYVLVAGETVWDNGKRTGKNPGVFLRGR